jgi:hypothetical protein
MMLNPVVIGVILAVVAVGLVIICFRLFGKPTGGYNWQPDLAYRAHDLDMLKRQNHSAIWLSEKSAEERHEEQREYLRERAKNDRHQDLD